MRAIVISDIHGNIDVLRALERRLGERLAEFERVICMGDLVDYGPYPNEVIEWIRERATDVVRGNHDHAVATGAPCESSPSYLQASIATRARLRDRLTPDAIDYLSRLPLEARVTVGQQSWLLIHATPREMLHDYVPAGATDEQWRAALGDRTGQQVLMGHTHMPFGRPFDGGFLANPGSIGMPKDGSPHGSYAILDGHVIQFLRIAYDPEPMIRELAALDLSGAIFTQLARSFRTGM